jgi:Acetyltransferase (GNAT) family
MSTCTEIDPKNESRLNSFYSVGAIIRAENDSFELPWADSKNITTFLASQDVVMHLLTVQDKGRIACFYYTDDPKTGFIGWYECQDDSETASKLFNAAFTWFKNKNVQKVYGPMSGTSWENYRFNIDSDKPIYAGEIYQPLYYLDQWKNAGFENEIFYETTKFPKEKIQSEMAAQTAEVITQFGLKLKQYPRNMEEDEFKKMHNFYLECFNANPFFREIPFDLYKSITHKAEQVADFDCSFIIADQNDHPVSVLIAFQDIYHHLLSENRHTNEANKARTIYIKTIATSEKWRNNKLSQLLVNYCSNEALKNGYEEIVFTNMFVGNISAIKSKEKMATSTLRTYTLMSKTL